MRTEKVQTFGQLILTAGWPCKLRLNSPVILAVKNEYGSFFWGEATCSVPGETVHRLASTHIGQSFNALQILSWHSDCALPIINRFCASGLESIAIATAKIKSGMSDCIIAGGVESMSYIPMTGFKPVPNYNTVSNGKEDYYWGMGLTAEQVANEYKVSRESQDLFAY